MVFIMIFIFKLTLLGHSVREDLGDLHILEPGVHGPEVALRGALDRIDQNHEDIGQSQETEQKVDRRKEAIILTVIDLHVVIQGIVSHIKFCLK